MNNEEVIQIISSLNDYADKKNNQGLKNVVLMTLIGIVTSILAGVIGYGYKEIYALRDENSDLKVKVVRLEMKQDVAMKEQNKVLFQMIEGMDKMAKTRRPPAAADDDDDQDEPLVILPDEEDEKFKNFHDSLNRRIQDRLPPEQMMEKK